MWPFLLLSVLVYNAAAFRIRKRRSRAEIYATIMFALFTNSLVDAFASFQFHAWGFFGKETAEFATLWIILGIYPAVTVLIINWYPFGSSWWKKLLYLLTWSAYSTGYEAGTLWLGIMWHDNWNLWFSFLLYPLIYYLLIVQLRAYRWIVKC